MQSSVDFAQVARRTEPHNGEAIGNPPSFEEVMREIAITILVYLSLALAAELFTRTLVPA